MSRLLRLYPATWRERYETEFLRLLQERPVAVRGSVDVVLGAIDAHLHPELVGAGRQPRTHRLPGLLAATAGLIWSWFWVHALLAAPDEPWGESVGLAVLLMAIAVPGDYLAAYGRRIVVTLLVILVAMFGGRTLPWAVADGLLNQGAGIVAWLLVAAGMLTLAAIRAGIGRGLRWRLLGLTVVVPAIIAIPILGGFGPGDRGGATAMLIALLPYGIAWTLLGLRMTIRGSATIHNTTSNPRAAEVPAT
jgi:hypothetical protein